MKLFFIFFLFISFSAHAIPIHGLSLRVVPVSENKDEILIGPKVIEVTQRSQGLQIKWFSLAKTKVEGAVYPTFKIKGGRGIIETQDLLNKRSFFHPHLWGEGFVRLSESLPLWVAPDYLQLKRGQELPFELGFLNTSRLSLQAVSDDFFAAIIFFQNTYRHYQEGHEPEKRTDQRDLKSFMKDYFQISYLSSEKTKVVVNGSVQILETKKLGNHYFELTVLDDPLNPLILSLQFLTDKAPKVFEKSFEFFKKNFEFRVTQINY